TSFGSGGLILAGIAMGASSQGKVLISIGRVLIGVTAIVFGVQHFLHPLALPGVPLVKQMPAWVPVPASIDYFTWAFLIVAGASFLLAWKSRMVAAYLGAWIVFLVLVIYVPVLIGALSNPTAGVQLEGLNYFADTLLFGAVILAIGRAASTVPFKGEN